VGYRALETQSIAARSYGDAAPPLRSPAPHELK
jgi:hypothetical protein